MNTETLKRMLMSLGIILGCGIIAAATQNNPPQQTKPTRSINEQLEVLHAISLNNGAVSFMVTSTGCTRKEHFSLYLQGAADNELVIKRIKRDNCRRAPFAIELSFQYEEFTSDKMWVVEVVNRLSPPRVLKRVSL